MSENDLIKGCKKGSTEAQSLLYFRYAPLLKGVCIRYVKDKDIASDLLHDSFIKIFKCIRDFKEDGSIEGWLRRIVINTALDYLKKAKPHIISEVNDYENLSDETTVDEFGEEIILQIIDSGFSKENLINMLNQLPQNYATVFNLFFIDGMSHKEIAKSMKITEGLSRKWTFRAKGLLKKLLIDSLQKGANYEK